jgi:hypothetical protein
MLLTPELLTYSRISHRNNSNIRLSPVIKGKAMASTPLQVTYRAIFTEMLLAQSAAIGAFADVAARCALLAGQECEQALITITRNMPPKGGTAGMAHPGGGSEVPLPRLADFARAFAGMPLISMMVFLSKYDKLRERRRAVQD